MNEEQFNMDVRKFLKQFGVGAQRTIEKAVQKGMESGQLMGAKTIRVRARLQIEGQDEEFVVEEELRVS
jgi:hypothetical protein